jgi:hypothetical protein
MATKLDLGCLWHADDERAYSMSGKLNLQKLDEETRKAVLATLSSGGDVKIVIFKNSYRDQNPKAPDFNILKSRGPLVSSPPVSQWGAEKGADEDVPF